MCAHFYMCTSTYRPLGRQNIASAVVNFSSRHSIFSAAPISETKRVTVQYKKVHKTRKRVSQESLTVEHLGRMVFFELLFKANFQLELRSCRMRV